MGDDFNTPQVLAIIFDLIRNLNPYLTEDSLNKKGTKDLQNFLQEIDSILGVLTEEQEKIPNKVMELVEKREKFREEKNYKEADNIRAQIETLGHRIDDTVYGPLVRKQRKP